MAKNEKKSSKSSAPSNPTAGMAVTTDAGKRARIRLGSTQTPGLWCRMFVDVAQEHGVPCDPDGTPWQPQQAPRGGLSAEERAQRKRAKEEEKARIAKMTPEERLEYAKAKKEAKRKKREAKERAQREALIKQVEAAVKAGKDPLKEILG